MFEVKNEFQFFQTLLLTRLFSFSVDLKLYKRSKVEKISLERRD
jgi:hypothetical protein